MKLTLQELTYIIPYGTQVELLPDEGVIGPIEWQKLGFMGYEILSIYPADKNLLVIRVKEQKPINT